MEALDDRCEIEYYFQIMEANPECVRERLAGTPGVSVDVCRCGCVHLTIGAVTMRLHPDAIGELARILGDARTELERRAAPAAQPAAWWS
jgi:hypothetical protein